MRRFKLIEFFRPCHRIDLCFHIVEVQGPRSVCIVRELAHEHLLAAHVTVGAVVDTIFVPFDARTAGAAERPLCKVLIFYYDILIGWVSG